jgi:ubiquinone/menaquinone biosynthesis C-methylase UbiE
MAQNLSLYSPYLNPAKVRLIQKYIQHGSCLDVGCGNGLYGIELNRTCESVMQLDIEDRRDLRSKEIPFTKMDVQNLNVPTESYDYAIAFDIMEHLADDSGFLKQLSRVCRKRIILSVPNADDESLRGYGLTHLHHVDKTHYREYHKDDLVCLVESVGLKVMDLIPQYNNRVAGMIKLFGRKNLGASLLAKMISFEVRLLLKAGIFTNNIIADWFCVADKN